MPVKRSPGGSYALGLIPFERGPGLVDMLSGRGSQPAYRGPRQRPQRRPRYDWNREQLALAAQERDKLLPILADLQQSREKNALEWALANQRLASDWAQGGRSIGFQGQQAGLDRALRESLQNQELAFRGSESAAERAYGGEQARLRDRAAMDRAMVGEQGALERALLSEGGATDRASMANQASWDRLLASLSADDKARLDNYLQQEKMARLSGELSGERDQRLHGFDLERMGVGAGIAEKQAATQQGYAKDLARMQNRFDLQRAGVQNQQYLDRMGAQDEYNRNAQSFGNLLDQVNTREDIAMRGQFDPATQRQVGNLLGELHTIRQKYGDDHRVRSQYLNRWLDKFDQSRITEKAQTAPTFDQEFGRRVQVDPVTGRRLQWDEKSQRFEWLDETDQGGAQQGGQPWWSKPFDAAFQENKKDLLSYAEADLKREQEDDTYVPTLKEKLQRAKELYGSLQDEMSQDSISSFADQLRGQVAKTYGSDFAQSMSDEMVLRANRENGIMPEPDFLSRSIGRRLAKPSLGEAEAKGRKEGRQSVRFGLGESLYGGLRHGDTKQAIEALQKIAAFDGRETAINTLEQALEKLQANNPEAAQRAMQALGIEVGGNAQTGPQPMPAPTKPGLRKPAAEPKAGEKNKQPAPSSGSPASSARTPNAEPAPEPLPDDVQTAQKVLDTLYTKYQDKQIPTDTKEGKLDSWRIHAALSIIDEYEKKKQEEEKKSKKPEEPNKSGYRSMGVVPEVPLF